MGVKCRESKIFFQKSLYVGRWVGGEAELNGLIASSEAVRRTDDQKTFTAVDGRSISLRRAYTVDRRVMVPLG